METRRRPSPSDARLACGEPDEFVGASELQEAAGDHQAGASAATERAGRRGMLPTRHEALKRHAYASTHTLLTGRVRKSSSAVAARQRSWGMIITGALVAFVYVACYGLGQQVQLPQLPAVARVAAAAAAPICAGGRSLMHVGHQPLPFLEALTRRRCLPQVLPVHRGMHSDGQFSAPLGYRFSSSLASCIRASAFAHRSHFPSSTHTYTHTHTTQTHTHARHPCSRLD